MKAFVVDADDTDRFRAVELDDPIASGRDLLVEVRAVGINPIDRKVRKSRPGQVLGWDAAGVVRAVGPGVKFYRPGDEVYYAGDLTRAGSNAALQLVDERIVGRKPKSLSFVEAAAIPLTALTAWEALFEQLEVRRGTALLMINGAGGVGSIAIQLARLRADMTVIATASRTDSVEWVRAMGAQHVVDHRKDLVEQVRALGFERVPSIFCAHDTAGHFDAMAELVAPSGRICSIVGVEGPLAVGKLFGKRAALVWELMFTKSMFGTDDMGSQREILDQVADLIDGGSLRCTLNDDGGVLDAEKLAEAHAASARESMTGKLAFAMG
ncbi:MAG: zinc-binding alcohol dehydrogenase family protein [bacterium]